MLTYAGSVGFHVRRDHSRGILVVTAGGEAATDGLGKCQRQVRQLEGRNGVVVDRGQLQRQVVRKNSHVHLRRDPQVRERDKQKPAGQFHRSGCDPLPVFLNQHEGCRIVRVQVVLTGSPVLKGQVKTVRADYVAQMVRL